MLHKQPATLLCSKNEVGFVCSVRHASAAYMRVGVDVLTIAGGHGAIGAAAGGGLPGAPGACLHVIILIILHTSAQEVS